MAGKRALAFSAAVIGAVDVGLVFDYVGPVAGFSLVEVSAWLIEGRGVRRKCGMCRAGTPQKKGSREILGTPG